MIWSWLSDKFLSLHSAFGVARLMAASGAAAEHAKAQAHFCIGMFLARAVDGTPGRGVKAVRLLEFAANHGSKAIAGEACYQLGLLHERRA